MQKFWKKPVVVTAFRWTPDMGAAGPVQVEHHTVEPDVAYVWTLEGRMIVNPGDWIVTGVAGEHYPCKPDIFEATYEPVDEEGD